MKINQAAELAGITSKNIRFYEDQGLGGAPGKPLSGKDGPKPSVRAKLNASKPLKWLPWEN